MPDREMVAGRIEKGMAARRAKERRFRLYGKLAIGLALAFLVTLFVSIFSKGIPGFFQYYVTLEVTLDREELDPYGDLSVQSLYDGDARGAVRSALYEVVGAQSRGERRTAGAIISHGSAERLRREVLDDPSILGTTRSMTFAVDDDVDSFLRGFISRDTPQEDRRINDLAISYVDELGAQGRISYRISDYLFFGSASRNPEMAGILGAFVGSMTIWPQCPRLYSAFLGWLYS